MVNLEEEIKKASENAVTYFRKQGITLDYSIESLRYIDAYYDSYLSKFVPLHDETLAPEIRSSLFAIGSYVGQTIIKNFKGSYWEITENDLIDPINTVLKLWDETMSWPFQKVMKRFYNGPEDSVYGYAHFAVDKYNNEQAGYSSNGMSEKTQIDKRPWYKFWK